MEVHITVCMALLVCELCQPVHSCIEPSIYGVDFFFRNLFMETLLVGITIITIIGCSIIILGSIQFCKACRILM